MQRNRHGEGRLVGVYRLRRGGKRGAEALEDTVPPSRLCLRLARNGAVDRHCCRRDEVELLPIRDRLIVDMSPRFRPVEPPRHLTPSPVYAA